jgi:uncharacterized protein (UPF0147 family)
MEKQRKDELIRKYNAGEATAAEKKEIEQLLESGLIDLNDLQDFLQFDKALGQVETPSPSLALDDRFYAMLAAERKRVTQNRFSWKQFFQWPQFAPRLAFASVLLLLGLAAGYLLRAPEKSQQIEVLSYQVRELKEMMMLTLLEKESATDRLKAVGLTQDMDRVSHKVTDALLQTLNHDENVNVRLAALDALKPYTRDSTVREALIRSIANQDSPLVQVALAELMATLQVKSSVKELEKILEDDKTPKDVRKKIQESIEVLI